MSSEAIRPRGRPARKLERRYYFIVLGRIANGQPQLDTPGTTVLGYTPDGRRVITGGSNSAIRIYTVGQDGEPTTVDEGVDGNLGIGATVCLPTLLDRSGGNFERLIMGSW